MDYFNRLKLMKIKCVEMLSGLDKWFFSNRWIVKSNEVIGLTTRIKIYMIEQIIRLKISIDKNRLV